MESGEGVVRSGVATQTLDYLPFGDVRVNAKQTSYDSDRKYLGKINDTATNLDYLEARYYQSPVGRFLSQDPMQLGVPDASINPQSLNYYSYANGNPIMLSDPSGLRAFTSAEIAYNQATFAQISQLTAMGKLDVANQMYSNLQAYMREVAGIPTGGGGNYVGGGGSSVSVSAVAASSPVASVNGGWSRSGTQVSIGGGEHRISQHP